MNDELRTAIGELNRLFKERNSSEWWSQNIIDASKNITTKSNWTKFYSYMYSPENFDPNQTMLTVEDCKEKADLSYPEGLEEIRYVNGNETTIHVKVKPVDVDDEKIK